MGQAQLARELAPLGLFLFFFDKTIFLILFLKQNKHNFLNKTPNELKLISKFLYKQNTLNKTQNLVFLKIKIMSLFRIEQGFNKTYVAYLKCHFSNNEIK